MRRLSHEEHAWAKKNKRIFTSFFAKRVEFFFEWKRSQCVAGGNDLAVNDNQPHGIQVAHFFSTHLAFKFSASLWYCSCRSSVQERYSCKPAFSPLKFSSLASLATVGENDAPFIRRTISSASVTACSASPLSGPRRSRTCFKTVSVIMRSFENYTLRFASAFYVIPLPSKAVIDALHAR